jgi:predicted CopG family antitoxin
MSTTIAVSSATRDELKEFGAKGETYDEILARLLKSAKERQLQELLMDTKGCLTIQEARAKLRR